MKHPDLAPPLPVIPGRPTFLAVASGKGGVGKTWLAITLSQALAEAGRRVLLFDGDLGLANIDIQLGLNPARDLAGVMAGQCPLEAAVAPLEAGFSVLPGRSGAASLAGMRQDTAEKLLAGLAALPFDLVLLDLGGGLDASNRIFAARAHALLVVATDEPTSLTDAYAVIKLHATDAPGGNAAIAVNQAATAASGRRTYGTLAQACSKFLHYTPPLAGVIRRDEHVRDAIRHQTPLLTRHPRCPAASDARDLAERLLGQHVLPQTAGSY